MADPRLIRTGSNRLVAAMLAYGALAASAFFTLSGPVRIFILLLFAALAIKTWVGFERQKLDDDDLHQNGHSVSEDN